MSERALELACIAAIAANMLKTGQGGSDEKQELSDALRELEELLIKEHGDDTLRVLLEREWMVCKAMKPLVSPR